MFGCADAELLFTGGGTEAVNTAVRGLFVARAQAVKEDFALTPEIAAALSVWRPVASGKDEVLEKGVPFIQSLARVHGLTDGARRG